MLQAMVQIGCGRHEQSSVSNLVLYFIVLSEDIKLQPTPTALALDFRKVFHVAVGDYISKKENYKTRETLQNLFLSFMQSDMDSESHILDEIEKAGYSFSPYPRTPLVSVYLLSNMDEFVSFGVNDLEPEPYSVFQGVGVGDTDSVSREIFDVIPLM